MTESEKNFGWSCRKIMFNCGIKHRWVADKIGMKYNTFCMKINGKRGFTLAEALAISEQLGETLENMVTGNIEAQA